MILCNKSLKVHYKLRLSIPQDSKTSSNIQIWSTNHICPREGTPIDKTHPRLSKETIRGFNFYRAKIDLQIIHKLTRRDQL